MSDDAIAVYEALSKAAQDGLPSALATITETQGSMPRHAGSKMLIYEDGQIVGTVGGGAMESKVIAAAKEVIATGKAVSESYTLNSLEAGDPGICGGTATIFIEAVAIAPSLLVIGGGHVGKALAELGKWLGYRVLLSDDRPEYCNESYVAGLDGYIICKPGEITEHITINQQSYIAAVTRGLPVDEKLIPALLKTEAAYIGLIGSRRRWAITAKQLQLSETDLKRIHAPIGLELEAETPKEIALSIMAEITMLRRGGTGQTMQWLGQMNEE
jgi:xanthine dehydrogenase accessory factor